MEVRRKLELTEESPPQSRERFPRVELPASFLKLIMDGLPVRVCYIDRDFRYRYVNKQYELELGVSREMLEGRTVAEAMGQPVFEVSKPHFLRALGGEQHVAELHMPYPAGHEWVRTTFYPDFAPGGDVRGLVCHVQNFTKEKLAALELTKQSQWLDQTLATAQLATFDWDVPNDRVSSNPLLNRFFALDEHASGLPISEFFKSINQEDRAPTMSKITQSLACGGPYEAQFRVSDCQGKERYVLARGHPELDAEGNPVRLAGVVLDITELAQAESALKASEERFRQLVELSPSTVWFGEPDGGLSYISQDYYEATNLNPEEALPHGWTTTVFPDDLPGVAKAWEEARRDETPYDQEFRIRMKDGEYRWISARALPVRDDQGRITGWLGSNSDIHQRKTSEERLQRAVAERTAELQNAVKEAESFNYSISHDLRAPLRSIIATSQIVAQEAGPFLSKEHRDLLARQSTNAARLATLIDELLNLSRLARVEVKRELFDLSEVARSLVVELEATCEVTVQDGMTAEGDRGLVRTVLQNLIDNACKFSPEGGTVWVGESEGTFWVKDQGIGFDQAYASKLFLPFERLVREDEFPGTGIGLANVKRIVERHGGRVWVTSEPGQGATFYFTLG